MPAFVHEGKEKLAKAYLCSIAMRINPYRRHISLSKLSQGGKHAKN